jgi:hypothetical protein
MHVLSINSQEMVYISIPFQKEDLCLAPRIH